MNYGREKWKKGEKKKKEKEKKGNNSKNSSEIIEERLIYPRNTFSSNEKLARSASEIV